MLGLVYCVVMEGVREVVSPRKFKRAGITV
jgi:hypothetical protein